MSTHETTIAKDVHDPALRARSQRVERLYQRLTERWTERQLRWGRDRTILDEPGAPELPLVVRRAKAFEKTLREMPIEIEVDDWIVGNSVRNGVVVRPQLPRYNTEQEIAQARAEGKTVGSGIAHKTPDYEALMSKGLRGILDEIKAKLTEVEARPRTAEQQETQAVFEAMEIECEAVVQLAARYARLAETKADRAESEMRQAELLQIAEVCRRVPSEPPQTLHEAIQSFWFVNHAFNCTGSQLSCGRIDQYLYPAYARDRAAERLTLDAAQELIDCLWLRFCDRTQVNRETFVQGSQKEPQAADDAKAPRMIRIDSASPWVAGHRKRVILGTDQADAINHWGENVMLSGIRADGTDGSNDLTYLCLNALDKFALTDPVITVRLHKDSPRLLLQRAAESLKSGGGFPFLDNDDAIIAGYIRAGIPAEDAREYANSNCWETLIAGRSDQELVRGMNLLLALELALNRGISSVYGRMGPDTGDPTRFRTFDDLMCAWEAQLDHMLQAGIDYIGQAIVDGTLEHSGHGAFSYNPLLSALMRDCIENERDVLKGGARYTIWTVMAEAFGNAVDSLAAIKKLVYEECTLTMEGALRVLQANWEGYASLRQTVLNRTPKYANDDEYADQIGRRMLRTFIDRTRSYAQRWAPTTLFVPTVGTFSWYQSIGYEVGASMDGRYAHDAVTANMSPVYGADRSGLPAAINSAVKMYGSELPGGAPVDLRASGSAFVGQDGTARLVALIQAFVALGGNMMTLTVTDAEELRNAMREPETYRHLRVRMGGWTAYFCQLGREQQELQLQRAIHGG
jgi:formate C-acetyltransferase